MWRWWKEHKRELIATPMAGVSRAQQIDPFPRCDWTSTADIQPHNRGRTAMRSQECAADESELFELVPSCSSGVPASRFNWTFSILPQGKMSTVFLHVHRVRPKVASAVVASKHGVFMILESFLAWHGKSVGQVHSPRLRAYGIPVNMPACA